MRSAIASYSRKELGLTVAGVLTRKTEQTCVLISSQADNHEKFHKDTVPTIIQAPMLFQSSDLSTS